MNTDVLDVRQGVLDVPAVGNYFTAVLEKLYIVKVESEGEIGDWEPRNEPLGLDVRPARTQCQSSRVSGWELTAAETCESRAHGRHRDAEQLPYQSLRSSASQEGTNHYRLAQLEKDTLLVR